MIKATYGGRYHHCECKCNLGFIDETLPIIKKPKHPKKGEIQGTKWKDPCPRRQMNHLREWTTRGTFHSQTPSSCEKHIN
jgi:hypothetical protein